MSCWFINCPLVLFFFSFSDTDCRTANIRGATWSLNCFQTKNDLNYSCCFFLKSKKKPNLKCFWRINTEHGETNVFGPGLKSNLAKADGELLLAPKCLLYVRWSGIESQKCHILVRSLSAHRDLKQKVTGMALDSSPGKILQLISLTAVRELLWLKSALVP